MADADQVYRFQGFALDLGRGLLFDAAMGEVMLRPKTLDLLTFFVRNAGRVVSKGELLEAVWPNVHVSEDSLTQCISDLRRALGDGTSAIIRTVPRRGYVFTQTADPHTTGQGLGIAPTASSGKPAIVVTAFENLSDEARQHFAATGLAQDVARELSRFTHLSVTAAQAAGGRGNGTAAYIVEGSIRPLGDKARIGIRLSEAESGIMLWSERYDRDLGELAKDQDNTVAAIVGAIEGKVVASGADHARRKRPEHWTAVDSFLVARDACDQYREHDALDHFRRAIALDPDFVQAHGWLAISLSQNCPAGIDWGRLMDEAERAAERALQLDRTEPTAHWAAALVALRRCDHMRAGLHFDEAVALNPADGQIRGDRANWMRLSGRAEDALGEVDLAQSMCPYSPRWFEAVRGYIYFDLGRYGDALGQLLRLPKPNPHDLVYIAATYAFLNEFRDAARAYGEVHAQGYAVMQSVLAAQCSYARPEEFQHLAQGLSRAALAAGHTL